MPRFTFRLQALLNLREQTRDQQRLALAEVLAQIDALAAQRLCLADELSQQDALRRDGIGGGRIEIEQLRAADHYARQLRWQIQALTTRQVQAETEVERRRELLVEADRELRVMEKMREREHETFQREQQSLETKGQDEAARGRTREEAA